MTNSGEVYIILGDAHVLKNCRNLFLCSSGVNDSLKLSNNVFTIFFFKADNVQSNLPVFSEQVTYRV